MGGGASAKSDHLGGDLGGTQGPPPHLIYHREKPLILSHLCHTCHGYFFTKKRPKTLKNNRKHKGFLTKKCKGFPLKNAPRAFGACNFSIFARLRRAFSSFFLLWARLRRALFIFFFSIRAKIFFQKSFSTEHVKICFGAKKV